MKRQEIVLFGRKRGITSITAIANAVRLNNPQLSLRRLFRHDSEHALEEGNNSSRVLRARTKDYNARRRTGRIGINIGEIEIERDQDPALGLAAFKKLRIVRTRQLFPSGCLRVIASIAKAGCAFQR